MSMNRRISEIERRLKGLEFPRGPKTYIGVATASTSTVSSASSTFVRVALAVFFAEAAGLGYTIGTVCPVSNSVEWRLLCKMSNGSEYPLVSGVDVDAGLEHTGFVSLPNGSGQDYTVEFQVRRSSGSGTVAGYLTGPFTVGK